MPAKFSKPKKPRDFFGGQFNLPELEEKVLNFWRSDDIFAKSMARRRGKKTFVFYEGPPYANGQPGIHHVLARAFKDIILRFRTMEGYFVPRRAGWDTHGLPTEIAVEKELGIKHKKEIEKLGIGVFNQKARESVWKYKEEWERLTDRIGYWLDLKHAYVTYTNDYIETMWWITKRVSDRGFLKENLKVVPYCSRCETPLASHELAMPGAYKKTKDPSVYIKFKLKGKKNEYLLVWTTTPWTLPGNLYIAASSELTYTKYRLDGEFLWSYVPPPSAEWKGEAVEKVSGKKLLGLEYEPLYKISNVKVGAHKVISGDFISTEEGTGFVHIAPAFGEEDFRAVEALGYTMTEIPITVDGEAKMVKGFPGAGKYIKLADEDVKADLLKRNLLYREEMIEHDYPFCWRCGSALIYMARHAWFFEMSRLRKDLVKLNETVNWVPGHLKEGRFGEWIKEAKDWAISRERYWGMPLPIWRCEKCDSKRVVGSLSELENHAYRKNEFWLIRHTEAEHNLSGLVASGAEHGKHISNLTKNGLAAAKKLAEKLKKEKFAAIYTSNYARTKAIAKLLHDATDAKVIVDERLGEIDCGVFNWKPVKDHKKFFKTPIEEFSKTPPGGENLSDVKRRMFAVVKEINGKYIGKKIAIVSHGDSLWMLEAALRQISNEGALEMSYIEPGETRKIKFPNLPLNENAELDMHRPYADDIELACEKCDGKMSRVKEVADVWFDSGTMPFSQTHFPFAQSAHGKIDAEKAMKRLPYPADYICEAIDQTRGWFYTLLAVATLLDEPAPYKNVLCLGLITDKNGQKMSKSKGNVVDPWIIVQKYGVDAVRWYFYTVNAPEESKNFDEIELAKSFRRFHMILYNSFLFYRTYALKSVSPPKSLHTLDRWILSRLENTKSEVTRLLQNYAVRDAALALERFVDGLSRWYIRRSRRRLQRPVSPADHAAASSTLGYAILELSKLISPFTPFFGEALYESAAMHYGKEKISESVHLTDWPKIKKIFIDGKLEKMMDDIREYARLGLAKRAELGIKVRQPLASVTVNPGERPAIKDKQILEILAEELNVKAIKFDVKAKEPVVLDTHITAELREEGIVREMARMVAELRQKAGLEPKDKIALVMQLPERIKAAIVKHETELKSDAGAKTIEYKKTAKFAAEHSGKFEEGEVWLGLRKI